MKAAFLDRDGTINVKPPEHEYVASPAEFRWLEGAPEAMASLGRAGFVLAVVSNQRGIARDLVSRATLREIEFQIQSTLANLGARVVTFRYCLHDLHEHCLCRKPAPGMILSLIDELNVNPAESWMIGDAESDVLAGRAAGCRTARLAAEGIHSEGDVVSLSLKDAVERILDQKGRIAGR